MNRPKLHSRRKLIQAMGSLGALAAASLFTVLPTWAQTPASMLTTLGTGAGAVPDRIRSQPANLLSVGTRQILIDTGDGVAEQLAKVGVSPGQITEVFLTHLHFDHTGGLFAILGLRFQVPSPGVLTVYGPPGTGQLVAGLMTAMQPAADVGIGLPDQAQRAPADGVRVIEIDDGSRLELDAIRVSAALNTHYSFPSGSAEANRYRSLALRFDMPDRSIAFTGDTGPSANVEKLARGADLLVSEVMDTEATVAMLRNKFPKFSTALLAAMRQHFLEQHLSPSEAGALAQRAQVKLLVLSHNAFVESGNVQAKAAIAAEFQGPVKVAEDLERF